MDYKSGKTFRNIDKGRKKDTSIIVNIKEPKGNPIELLGHEFYPGLSYSMKKKQRWQLFSNIPNGTHNEEIPIVYTKHQCIHDDWPELDLYLFDSLTNKTIGTVDVSNRKLEKGKINIRSAIHQIESMNDYTVREKKSFEKTKRKMKNIKKSRMTANEVLEMDDQLPPKAESLLNKEVRQSCVYVHEFVHVNDLSRVNIIQPYHYKYSKNYNVRKEARIDHCQKEYSDFSGEEFEDDIDDTAVVTRPFVMSDGDFISRKKEGGKERKKQRKNKLSKNIFSYSLNDNEEEYNCNKDALIIEYDDMLPSIVVNMSRDQFVTELESLTTFCKCWHSSISPFTILIDLDQFEESINKSWLIVRPIVEKEDNEISVKVLINVSKSSINWNEIFGLQLDGLVRLVTFIQSRLQSGTFNKLSMLSKVVILDESIDEVSYLPTVKLIDRAPQYLYLFHEEWKNCELNADNFESIMAINGELNYSMDVCSVGKCVLVDDEMILIGQCQHRVCHVCLRGHIIKELDAYNIDIICPHNDCFVKLDVPTILSLVSWDHYYQLRLSMLESVVSSRCGVPCIDCGSILMTMDEERSKVIEYVCVCRKTVCSGCGHSQHWPSSCQEMKVHNVKVDQLLDEENVRLKYTPVNCINTINCSSCRQVIANHSMKPYLKCPCKRAFCRVCRLAYTSHIDECKVFAEERKTFHNSMKIVPFQEAKSSGLKLYNQSVYLTLLLRKDNLDIFKRDLFGIVSSSMVTRIRPYSSDDITRIYCQVLRILESMFVSAYNRWRRTDPNKWRQLRVTTDQLLFYVCRIRSLTEEISGCMKTGLCPVAVVAHKEEMIRQKYARLEAYIDDARRYARKTVKMLKLD